MTPDTRRRAATAGRASARARGWCWSPRCSCVYGGLALTVDFPRAAMGIQSDEATYYMMGHSLAEDGDLTYRREDLVRVWSEFPSGPSGLFLKTRARHRRCRADAASAVRLDPHRAGSRPEAILLRQGVRLSAVRGAVRAALRHERLSRASRDAARARRLVRLPVPACADERDAGGRALPARSSWRRSCRSISSGSRRSCSTSRSDFWRISAGSTRRSERRERAPRGTALAVRRRERPRPPCSSASPRFRRSPTRCCSCRIVAWLSVAPAMARERSPPAWSLRSCAGGLFLANMAISGEWNFQGGDALARSSGSSRSRSRRRPSRSACRWAATSRLPGSSSIGGCSGRTWFTTSGTTSSAATPGIVPYYFPAVFALVAFLCAPRRRPAWQYLVAGRGGRADAVLHHQSAVHLDRRRRLGRQPLLHGGVRDVPVPAAAVDADRRPRQCPGRSARFSPRSWS